MVYESPRTRRIKKKQADKAHHRQDAKRFFLVIGLITTFTVTCLFFASRDKNGVVQLFGADKSKTIKEMPKQSAGEKITKALPDKLTEFNKELNINNRTGLADLPTSTSTAVAVTDLSGKNRGNVNYNGDTQFTSASTYKIYVAYAMIHDVETGRRNWSSPINGTTWETCLARTIVNSDNDCPEIYINSIGYSKFNSIVDGLGVSSVTQFEPYGIRTSANDLALVLQKFYKGELVSEDNKNKLFSLMEQQVYRDGIPAGIGNSAKVADKVGFLDALLHDAGIIFSDKGDYIMVVMTNGESWPYIAKVASYIHSVMVE